jgi:hypothetical protein
MDWKYLKHICCSGDRAAMPSSSFHRAALNHRSISPQHAATTLSASRARGGCLEISPLPLSQPDHRRGHLLSLRRRRASPRRRS